MREDITKASKEYWSKASKWVKKFGLKSVKVKKAVRRRIE